MGSPGMSESDLAVVRMAPGRWGDPAHPVELPAAALEALKHLGVRGSAGSSDLHNEGSYEGGPSEDIERALQHVLGEGQVRTDLETRWGHTRGYSTPDL